MGGFIRQPRDFLAGLLFVAFGAAFLWESFAYRMGTARSMGPGWFPSAVSMLLIAVGAAITLKSLFGERSAAPRFDWSPLIVIMVALGAFASLLRPMGLIPSVIVLVIGSAAAYHNSGTWRVLVLGLLGTIAAFQIVAPLSDVAPALAELKAAGLWDRFVFALAFASLAAVGWGAFLAFPRIQFVRTALMATGLAAFCAVLFIRLQLPVTYFGRLTGW